MNRNVSYSRYRREGFTWIKIVVVIVIALALALIVVRVMFPRGSRLVKQTRVTLKNISLKLDDYASEHNGIYPVDKDGSSAVLYQVLSGDESGRGEAPTGPVYWKELNDPSNTHIIRVLNGKRVIIDEWGNSLRYWSALDENEVLIEKIKNDGDYDLWSTGPDGKPSHFPLYGTFMNEETEDDVWR